MGLKAGVYGEADSGYQKYLRYQNSKEFPDSHRFPNHKAATVERFQHILSNAKKNKTIDEGLKKNLGLKNIQ
jgi:DNA (cytosine-5)-methyltransferase 1